MVKSHNKRYRLWIACPTLLTEVMQKRQYEAETADMKNLRLCFPPMDGQVNCMHSKLMLLFHPNYLRIVVPSANLVPSDWGEVGGFMENVGRNAAPSQKSSHSRTHRLSSLSIFRRNRSRLPMRSRGHHFMKTSSTSSEPLLSMRISLRSFQDSTSARLRPMDLFTRCESPSFVNASLSNRFTEEAPTAARRGSGQVIAV